MESFLKVAREAALVAGEVQQARKNDLHHIEFKGEINLVTEVDHACETAIFSVLEKHFPDHQILSEEAGAKTKQSPYKWIIDPLDGTTNYAHGYPLYCVSIALEKDGEVIVGVIYEPNLKELFEVIRGAGATLNGEKIKVSETATLKRALLVTGFAYNVQEVADNNLGHFTNFILGSQAVRRDGVAAADLAYIACGRYDGFWELGLFPWDVAAGALMITEAGGQLSHFDGSPVNIYSKQIVASNGRIHQEMIQTLKG